MGDATLRDATPPASRLRAQGEATDGRWVRPGTWGLERFGTRLRDEVALSADLRPMVADTMAPAHVALRLPAPEAGR